MRKYLVSITLVGIIVLFWYLFILPHDFKVSFSVKALPGTINQTLKAWNNTLDNATIVYQKSINSLEQHVIVGDHDYIFKWEISLINDSTSNVNVSISEPNNSLLNKIAIPFLNTAIEKDAKNLVKSFYDRIKDHLNFIGIKIEGMSEIERTYCVYTSIKTTQIGKAQGMMNSYPLLSSFIAEHGLDPKGLPIVEITEWNMEQDSIKFNFCLPIVETDSLPKYSLIKYKWLEQTKAIKAVYNGNYITSDRAWYALMHYAKKKGIEVRYTPIEIYYNNPNFGGNEKKWRADIYLPIK